MNIKPAHEEIYTQQCNDDEGKSKDYKESRDSFVLRHFPGICVVRLVKMK
jgi:hypothetical protein